MGLKKAFTKSSNPLLGEEKYKSVIDAHLVEKGAVMTVQGAINKTFLLMTIMLGVSLVSFMFPSQLFLWTGIGGIFIISFIAARNLDKAPVLAPIYAVALGLFAGTLTSTYWNFFAPGLVFKAMALTVAILFMMLMIYKAGWIKVTEKFRAGVTMAVGAVMIFYLINIVCYFIGIDIPFLHDGGLFSIGITLVIIGIATMNLLLDFDNFEKGEELKAPDYMEWYFAMGLMFTLVWLYIEILRLLSYLSSD